MIPKCISHRSTMAGKSSLDIKIQQFHTSNKSHLTSRYVKVPRDHLVRQMQKQLFTHKLISSFSLHVNPLSPLFHFISLCDTIKFPGPPLQPLINHHHTKNRTHDCIHCFNLTNMKSRFINNSSSISDNYGTEASKSTFVNVLVSNRIRINIFTSFIIAVVL